MQYKLISSSPLLPLTLQEAKDHLRVVDGFDDSTIVALIQAAANTVQNYTWRPLVEQQWQLLVDYEEALVKDEFILTKTPVLSISKVEYYNANNTLTELPTTDYQTDVTGDPARVKIIKRPTVYNRYNTLIITFTCGYVANVGSPVVADSVDAGHNIITEAAHGLNNNDTLTITNIGSTTGLAYDTVYYVINRTPNTFQLSHVPNGTAIDLDGPHSLAPTYQRVSQIPAPIKSALKLMIGHLFEHREDVVVGASVTELPLNSKYLLEPYVQKNNYPI